MSTSKKQRKKTRHRIRSKLLIEYLEFLRNYQKVSQATIVIRRNYVSPFLIVLKRYGTPSKIGGLSSRKIHDYIIKTSKPMNRASRKHLTSSLRSFLRFIHVKGYICRNLVDVVPVIATRNLDRLPRGISWENVQKLLNSPDRSTSSGRRDYAILQILVTYGVRIGQVTHLKLRNIDWHNGHIYFQQSKGGKPLCFPLKPEVAGALLTYLRKDRGKAPFKEVFLTVRGEPKPLSLNNHLGSALETYYKRAGISSDIKGSHAIRHAFATRLMEQKIPIKTIADLLGHRYINSTYIYTKVDVAQLRLLAREWPEKGVIS